MKQKSAPDRSNMKKQNGYAHTLLMVNEKKFVFFLFAIAHSNHTISYMHCSQMLSRTTLSMKVKLLAVLQQQNLHGHMLTTEKKSGENAFYKERHLRAEAEYDGGLPFSI